jgi:hypothetical protein
VRGTEQPFRPKILEFILGNSEVLEHLVQEMYARGLSPGSQVLRGRPNVSEEPQSPGAKLHPLRMEDSSASYGSDVLLARW